MIPAAIREEQATACLEAAEKYRDLLPTLARRLVKYFRSANLELGTYGIRPGRVFASGLPATHGPTNYYCSQSFPN